MAGGLAGGARERRPWRAIALLVDLDHLGEPDRWVMGEQRGPNGRNTKEGPELGEGLGRVSRDFGWFVLGGCHWCHCIIGGTWLYHVAHLLQAKQLGIVL